MIDLRKGVIGVLPKMNGGTGNSHADALSTGGLTAPAIRSLSAASPPAGIAIGDAVGGGTATRILFLGAGPVLAQDAGLTWDPTNATLSVAGKTTGGYVLYITDENGNGIFKAQPLATGPTVGFGDLDGAYNLTSFSLDDTTGVTTITFSAGGCYMQMDGVAGRFTIYNKIEVGGDVTVSDSSKGFVLKDTQGSPHYWRMTISNVGVPVFTDLGTSPP